MPDHTHAERLAAIHARAAAATPGPWEYIRASGLLHTMGQGNSIPVARWVVCGSDRCMREDAEFIAHAREDIPYLLAHIADLEARLADLEASPAIAGRPLPEHATLHFDPDELADADADFSTIELDPAKVRRAASALE